MGKKIVALKTSSKVISVITKIGYIVLLVTLCLCVAMLIFLGVTGGETAMFTLGQTNIVIFDDLASTPAELAAMCFTLAVMGGMFFVIFLLAHRMFHEISLTGEPFVDKYGRSVRVIGILTAATPFVTGFAELIIGFFVNAEVPEELSDAPGIIIGAIIFCLSYIIDYGCGIKKQLAYNSEGSAGI